MIDAAPPCTCNAHAPLDMSEFTPTQRRMLRVLADGMPHKREELAACLWDDLSDPAAVGFHVSNLRKRLRPFGQTIVLECVNVRTFRWRHVRLLLAREG